MTCRILAANAETVYFSGWIYPAEYRIPAGLDAARAAPAFRDLAGGRVKVDRPGFNWEWQVIVDTPDGGRRRVPGVVHFDVSQGGSQAGFHYVLSNQDLVIQAARHVSSGSPAVFIQLRSSLVWAVGWQLAVAYALDLAQSIFGRVNRTTLSRVDLTLDVTGWEFTPADLHRFVGRARKISEHSAGGEELIAIREKTTTYYRPKFTGVAVGMGGDVSCRVYDKLEEIKANSGKKWMFPIWKAAGWDTVSRVWRIEYQLRRPVLLELGLDSYPDLDLKISGAWKYLTQKWLRLALPKSDGYRKCEWETDPIWEQVQAARFGDGWGMLTRAGRDEASPEQLEAMLRGVASTLSAKKGVADDPEALLNEVSRVLFAEKGNFVDDVRRKLVKYQGGQVLRYNPGGGTSHEKQPENKRRQHGRKKAATRRGSARGRGRSPAGSGRGKRRR